MLRRAGATALMLQHALVTPAAVARAHALGAPVLAWTVDEQADLDRVVAAGVDGVISNDPRIFATAVFTSE
jgi:glycerophosphoryl diester phosphodiesterase